MLSNNTILIILIIIYIWMVTQDQISTEEFRAFIDENDKEMYDTQYPSYDNDNKLKARSLHYQTRGRAQYRDWYLER